MSIIQDILGHMWILTEPILISVYSQLPPVVPRILLGLLTTGVERLLSTRKEMETKSVVITREKVVHVHRQYSYYLKTLQPAATRQIVQPLTVFLVPHLPVYSTTAYV